ncbi:OVARIAN TUMOR DOMAIN-containing deubiquitinating enzyme 4 isoform X2 [Andrographis paniculata]|uniref:OVARIAN TUMOR DOMAIN-containing deubiquitinating enzyme 4 isoform X2 n=1 Tax=Andrographis paniculata TaxID=175694 RepID=UPI0021E7214F|nr:OVARIAN TUMOR DOMAIN-containing deubiquitinating enzyme 4 isoform X2 [Andrographis paniculata]
MTVCTPITTCSKNVVCLIKNVQRQMVIHVSDAFVLSPYNCCAYGKHSRLHYATICPSSRLSINGFQAFQSNCFRFVGGGEHSKSCNSLSFKSLVNRKRRRRTHINVSTGWENMNLRLLMPKQTNTSKFRCSVGPFFWQQQRSVSAGLFLGLLVCFCTPQPSYAEVFDGDERKEGCCEASAKKEVLTDYSVIGIPGDGRCLFRSVAHGACVRAGKPPPSETNQRELADELRSMVADEFIKRRKETEWFIEGDFDTYVSQMRKPHIWGGEPELLMASHVLHWCKCDMGTNK